MKKSIFIFAIFCLTSLFGANLFAQVKTTINAPKTGINNVSLTPLAAFQLAVKGQEYIYHNSKFEGAYKVVIAADGKTAKITLGEASCQGAPANCELGTLTFYQDGEKIAAKITKNRVNYMFTFTLSGDANDAIAYLSVNHTIIYSSNNKKTGFGILNRRK